MPGVTVAGYQKPQQNENHLAHLMIKWRNLQSTLESSAVNGRPHTMSALNDYDILVTSAGFTYGC